MIYGWMFLVILLIVNMAANWLAWGDPAIQGFIQFLSTFAIGLVSFGLGMANGRPQEEEHARYRAPTVKRK